MTELYYWLRAICISATASGGASASIGSANILLKHFSSVPGGVNSNTARPWLKWCGLKNIVPFCSWMQSPCSSISCCSFQLSWFLFCFVIHLWDSVPIRWKIIQKFDVHIFICSIPVQKIPFLVGRLIFFLLTSEIKYILGSMYQVH